MGLGCGVLIYLTCVYMENGRSRRCHQCSRIPLSKVDSPTAMMFTVIFLAIISVIGAHSLQKGDVKQKFLKHSDDIYIFKITDGEVMMKGTTSLSRGMQSCRLTNSRRKAQQAMDSPGMSHQHIGMHELKQLKTRCKHIRATKSPNRRDSNGSNESKEPALPTREPFNQDLVKGQPFPGDLGTGQPGGAGSNIAIFPGTKWCGYENNADNEGDLGPKKLTDQCCRTHDHCPYYIDRFETKFHYTNDYPWTVSHCACDQHLYDCLESVSTATSNEVGSLFFGLLNVKCFTFETGSYCVKEHWSHLYCQTHATGPMAVMQTFPHKWKNGNSTAAAEGNESAPVIG